jgi:hypothetical protein
MSIARLAVLLLCGLLIALAISGCGGGGGTKILCHDGTLVDGNSADGCSKHGGLVGSGFAGGG